ncbi:MAG: hypothetical protein DRQ97_07505 [Gammaproteobacteria bacterium]|nr:MAG: hypothetical protein DRQ97_07505 [Gammaproteobacteria bacterium]
MNADSRVVFYSTGHMMWATRAWWMLHSCGHRNVAVLDGGFANWRREGRAITDEVLTAPGGDLEVSLNSARWADKEQVVSAISDASGPPMSSKHFLPQRVFWKTPGLSPTAVVAYRRRLMPWL